MNRRTAVVLGLVMLDPAGISHAAEPLPIRKTGMGRFGGRLHVDVGLGDLFWPTHRKNLRSGFATRVLVRVSIYPVGSDVVVSYAFTRTEIVFDIWDESFRVHRVDSNGRDERFEVSSEREAIDLATVLRRFPVAEEARLGRGRLYRIAFRADLNPLSQELVADVRRSLVGSDSRRGGLAGDSFFGSFVSIFVNPRIEDSERQLRFVSQSFVERR
jgi:hypothetical protein